MENKFFLALIVEADYHLQVWVFWGEASGQTYIQNHHPDISGS